MKNIKLLSIVVLFTFELMSCKKEKETTKSDLSSIEMTNTKLIFAVSTGNGTSEIYKIKSDDSIEALVFKDQNGKQMEQFSNLFRIGNGNQNFLLLSYGNQMGSDGYLVNKNTGSVKKLQYAPTLNVNGSGLANRPLSLVDNQYNIYYLGNASYKNIVKLTTVNPNFVMESAFSDNNVDIEDFEMDGWRNIYYTGYNYQTSAMVVKIKKDNNSLITVPLANHNAPFWIGKNYNFYYIKYASNEIDSASYNSTSDSYTFGTYYGPSSTFSLYYRKDIYRYSYGNLLVLVDRYNNNIYEIENASHTPTLISSIPISDITFSAAPDLSGYLYLVGYNTSGKSNIFKVDLNSSYTYSTLTTDDKYLFSDIEVFEDGTVYFLAQRNSDGKYIVGKIDASGVESVLNVSINKPGFELEKVSEFVAQ